MDLSHPLFGEHVSRETQERISTYVETLLKWNKKINLIGRATADQVWQRHIIDSAQLNRFAPESQNWIDIGSGAGLPALIVAALRIDIQPKFQMTVVESDQRKCAFMAEASRKMGISVRILNKRIETVKHDEFDTISARALAPLDKLLGYAAPLRAPGAVCLFPKGANVDQELTDARKHWHMTVKHHPSVTDDASVILEIRAFERVA